MARTPRFAGIRLSTSAGTCPAGRPSRASLRSTREERVEALATRRVLLVPLALVAPEDEHAVAPLVVEVVRRPASVVR